MIKNCLIWSSLPLTQYRGQAYDSTSNMSGHINGTAAKNSRSEPTTLYVHCLPHCTKIYIRMPAVNWQEYISDLGGLTMELRDFIW